MTDYARIAGSLREPSIDELVARRAREEEQRIYEEELELGPQDKNSAHNRGLHSWVQNARVRRY